MKITLDTYKIAAAERQIIEAALKETGSICEAGKLTGLSRHALKRRMIKYNIRLETSRAVKTPETT